MEFELRDNHDVKMCVGVLISWWCSFLGVGRDGGVRVLATTRLRVNDKYTFLRISLKICLRLARLHSDTLVSCYPLEPGVSFPIMNAFLTKVEGQAALQGVVASQMRCASL